MLTFVLLYIIIITSLGVITPTYVNIYMYIFLHMYSVYQNIYLVDFVESNALTTRKKWAFIVPLYVLVVRSHLTNLLISLFSGYSPRSPYSPWFVSPLCIITGEYPEKRHFFKMVVWKGQPYASAKETHASVSFLRGLCWLLIFFVV